MNAIPVAIALVISIAATPLVAGEPPRTSANPIAVGTVDWGRDVDRAFAEAARTGKPVFALFQEVPGCSGCQRFGADVMSHPPIVEAVQSDFVPLLVYNNRGGKDAELLERYGEPAWNYQVIRFLDGEGHDVIPRKGGVWTREALASRMIEALEAAGRQPPRYLEVVAYEGDAKLQQTAAFAQSCFWSGEVTLGQLPGVIATEAGWIGGREVTRVRYRPDLVSLDALVDRAVAAGVAETVYLPTREQRKQLRSRDDKLVVESLGASYRKAGDSDQKRQIRDSPLFRLDLSPMQLTKVNAFATVDLEQALAWLTPGQRAELERLQAAGSGPDAPQARSAVR